MLFGAPTSPKLPMAAAFSKSMPWWTISHWAGGQPWQRKCIIVSSYDWARRDSASSQAGWLVASHVFGRWWSL